MTLQENLFRRAAKQLDAAFDFSSQEKFWKNYRKVRTHAFELEFLGKFYRNSGQPSLFAHFIQTCKALEDRLGRVDEIDAMIPFCDQYQLSYRPHFLQKRKEAYYQTMQWLHKHGWLDGSALAEVHIRLEQICWLDDSENREFAQAELASFAHRLQRQIDQRKYDPRHRHGYRRKEVETRVHKLRREVRKIAQFMSYSRLFHLVDRPSLKAYSTLSKSSVAKSPFATLPKALVRDPLPVPRSLYLAITRYVDELGRAKDWAYNLERLQAAGAQGEVDFNQLDATLRDWRDLCVPFNALVLGILHELRMTRLFEAIAQAMDKAR
jgi:hypothetical protein